MAGRADAVAFLSRLTRLDPAAVVRLRSAPATGSGREGGRTVLWARLPWGVLVGRTVPGAGPGDATVSAAELLAELARAGVGLPVRRDAQWRWPLPPPAGRTVETLSGADLRRVAQAAAGTLRNAAKHGVAGRAIAERALRDALLDHVAVVVTEPSAGVPSTAGDVGRIEVSQRLVQAVVRMGFLGAEGAGGDRVQVRSSGRWVGLSAPYGNAWSLTVGQLTLMPTRGSPNG